MGAYTGNDNSSSYYIKAKLSPDGSLLASGATDDAVCLWRVGSPGQPIARLVVSLKKALSCCKGGGGGTCVAVLKACCIQADVNGASQQCWEGAMCRSFVGQATFADMRYQLLVNRKVDRLLD